MVFGGKFTQVILVKISWILEKFPRKVLRVIVEDPSGRQKAQQQGQQRFGKQVAKPSGPSGWNDGSQVHEINKWALRR